MARTGLTAAAVRSMVPGVRGRVALSAGVAVLAASLIAAACLRALHLGGCEGLTGDEAFTLALAQRPFLHMLGLFRREGNGVSYPLVTWPLVRVDQGVALLRLPALLAGTAAVAALYWTGTRLVGRRAALTAAALLAISPLAISYSQLARPYMFALLFGVLSFGCLDRALAEHRGRRWWVLYVAATAAAAYSSALALSLLLPQAVLLLRHRNRSRQWLTALVALSLALVPLAVLLVWERSKRNPLYWLDRPGLRNLNNVATQFTVDRYGLLIGALLVLLALPSLAARRRGTSTIGMAAVAAWAFVPIALLFLLSQIVSPLFWIGYTLPALPGVLLLIAAAAARAPRPIAAIGLLALLLLSLRASVLHPDWFHPTGWRAATASLATQRRTGDPVVFDIPDGLGPAGYYDDAFAAADRRLVVSEWPDEQLPRAVFLLDDPGGYGNAPAGPPSRSLVARLSHRTGSVFMMLYEINRQGEIDASSGVQWAMRHCTLHKKTFGDEITMISIQMCRVHRGP